jgi:hypothetical protein
MRLLICSECGQPNALFRTWAFDGTDEMCWSQELNEHIHPSCVEATLHNHEIAFGSELGPMRRLLGINKLKEEPYVYERDK